MRMERTYRSIHCMKLYSLTLANPVLSLHDSSHPALFDIEYHVAIPHQISYPTRNISLSIRV